MGGCSQCECPGYCRRRHRKANEPRRCVECAHLKVFHDQPEPEPSSDEDPGEDVAGSTAPPASVAPFVPSGSSTIAASSSSSTVAKTVATTTTPSSSTSILTTTTATPAPSSSSVPGQSIVQAIIGRYIARSTGTSQATTTSVGSTASASPSTASILTPVAAPSLPFAEAIQGWRPATNKSRKKAADEQISSGRKGSKAGKKAETSSSSKPSKGKEREVKKKTGFLVVLETPIEWDLNIESDPVIGKSLSFSERQSLGNRGFAVLATDRDVEYSPNMNAYEVVEWVCDLLPRVGQFIADNRDRFDDNRSPLVLLQKNNRSLQLVRHPHPTGRHIEMCMCGKDQDHRANGIYMALSWPVSQTGSDEDRTSPARGSLSDDDASVHESAGGADDDDYKPPKKEHKSANKRAASPEVSSRRASKRAKRSSPSSGASDEAGSSSSASLFVRDTSDELLEGPAPDPPVIEIDDDDDDDSRSWEMTGGYSPPRSISPPPRPVTPELRPQRSLLSGRAIRDSPRKPLDKSWRDMI